jgi:drug/metabolite transporter (DMT)-like permease
VIYSSEGLFSALGGWVMLNEQLGLRGWLGALLICAAMVLAQWQPRSAAVAEAK